MDPTGGSQARLWPQDNDVASRQAALWIRTWVGRSRCHTGAHEALRAGRRDLGRHSVSGFRDTQPTLRSRAPIDSRRKPRDTSDASFQAARAQSRTPAGSGSTPAPSPPARRPRTPPAFRAARRRPRCHRQGAPRPGRFPFSPPPSARAPTPAFRPGVPDPRLLPVPPRRHLGIVQHSRLGGVRLEAQDFLP